MRDHRFIIELEGEAAGLVVGEQRGFRFYSAGSSFADLDHRLFRSPGQAEEACRSLLMITEVQINAAHGY